MNTLLLLLIVSVTPPQPHFADPPVPKFAEPIMPASEWLAQVVGNTTIELPLPEAIETAEYQRTAPDNYKIPSSHWTKRVPAWCPHWPTSRHGYSCGMSQTVEDLAGHLQSAHGVPLETLNAMGRDKWQSYHEDLEWCDETPERQALFISPRVVGQLDRCPACATKIAKEYKEGKSQPAKSGCGPGGCPSGNCPRPSYQPRLGLFSRWR